MWTNHELGRGDSGMGHPDDDNSGMSAFEPPEHRAWRSAIPASLVLTLMVFALGARTTPVHACSCLETTRLGSYLNADIVFDGTLLSVVEAADPAPMWDRDLARFRVDEPWKGVEGGREIDVLIEMQDTSCALDIASAERWSIYAYWASYEGDSDERLHTGTCSGTRSGPEAIRDEHERIVRYARQVHLPLAIISARVPRMRSDADGRNEPEARPPRTLVTPAGPPERMTPDRGSRQTGRSVDNSRPGNPQITVAPR